MKIAIFTEAGSAFGYGHLSRCAALKQGLESLGAKVKAYVRGDAVVQDWFVATEWLSDFDAALLENVDIAVLDSYHAPKEFYDKVAKSVKFGVWFDDTSRIPYPAGYVIHGKDAALLRKAFWEARDEQDKKSPDKIFISFGKTDQEPLMTQIVLAVRNKFPKASFIFASKAPQELIRNGDEVLIDANEYKIANSMQACTYAISAGGQTLLELASLGVPSVAVIIAENQIASSKRLLDNGQILGLVDIKDEDWAPDALILLGQNKKINRLIAQTKAVANDILSKFHEKEAPNET